MPSALYDATLGSLSLKQVTAANFSNNGTPIEGVVSGGLDVGQYFGGPADLRATFDTEDVGSVCAVSNIATAGLAVSSGTVSIPFQERADLSTFTAGAAHYVLSSANALILPTRFEVSETGNAVASLEAIFKSTDGDTPPVTTNVNQSLSAQSFGALYGLGPVAVNGTTLSHVIGFTVTPGLTVNTYFFGKNFVQLIPIVARRPMIQVRQYALEDLSALGAAWGVGTAIAAYARKRSGVSWVADATAEHCKFSGTDGLIKPVEISASGNGDGTRTITFWLESLVVSGASAIT